MRYSRRKGRKIKEKEGSAIGRYIRSTADITKLYEMAAGYTLNPTHN
jgi:hypothetical protein